jgi:hypothetical protein
MVVAKFGCHRANQTATFDHGGGLPSVFRVKVAADWNVEPAEYECRIGGTEPPPTFMVTKVLAPVLVSATLSPSLHVVGDGHSRP